MFYYTVITNQYTTFNMPVLSQTTSLQQMRPLIVISIKYTRTDTHANKKHTHARAHTHTHTHTHTYTHTHTPARTNRPVMRTEEQDGKTWTVSGTEKLRGLFAPAALWPNADTKLLTTTHIYYIILLQKLLLISFNEPSSRPYHQFTKPPTFYRPVKYTLTARWVYMSAFVKISEPGNSTSYLVH